MSEPNSTMPPPQTPPNTPEEIKRPKKRRRDSSRRGDSAHLKEWRDFFREWVSRHEGDLEGVKIIDRAKLAGIAYRHVKAKKRPSDPPKPEFP